MDLVVIGGSALIALQLVDRTTRNVDVVALMADGSLVSATPLPPLLAEARDTVAADFGIDERADLEA